MSAVFLIGSMGTFGRVVVVMSVPFCGFGRGWRDGWFSGRVVGERGERDQRDAEVAQLVEQAVQRCLVGHGAGDDGGAVVVGGEAQSVEPSRPSGPEMSLDADLVLRNVGVISGRR